MYVKDLWSIHFYKVLYSVCSRLFNSHQSMNDDDRAKCHLQPRLVKKTPTRIDLHRLFPLLFHCCLLRREREKGLSDHEFPSSSTSSSYGKASKVLSGDAHSNRKSRSRKNGHGVEIQRSCFTKSFPERHSDRAWLPEAVGLPPTAIMKRAPLQSRPSPPPPPPPQPQFRPQP